MNISGISSGMNMVSQLSHAQGQAQVQARQAVAANDADHDGDVDGPGPDNNDSLGKNIDIRA